MSACRLAFATHRPSREGPTVGTTSADLPGPRRRWRRRKKRREEKELEGEEEEENEEEEEYELEVHERPDKGGRERERGGAKPGMI